MKARTFILLLLAALGVGFYLHYGVDKASEAKKEQDEKDAKLFAGLASATKTLVIRTATYEIRLEKNADQWWLSSPVKDLAALNKMETALAALDRLKKIKDILPLDQIAASQAQLKSYGLQEPLVSLEFQTDASTETLRLRLGIQNPSKSGTYARLDDGPIVLASSDMDYLANQKADDYRELKHLTVAATDISELSIKRKAQPQIKLRQDKNANWEFVEPWKDIPVDQVFAKGKAEKIALLRANEFLSKPPVQLKNPDIQIVLGFNEAVKDQRTKPADRRPQGAEISMVKVQDPKSKKDFVFYAESDKAGASTISEFHFDNFVVKPEDFVRRTFEDLNPSSITDIQVVAAQGWKAARKESGFTLEPTFKGEKAQPKTASIDQIESALKRLSEMKAVSFLGTGSEPAKSQLKIVLGSGAPGAAEEMSFSFDKRSGAAFLWVKKTKGPTMKFSIDQSLIPTDSWSFEGITKPAAPAAAPPPQGGGLVDDPLQEVIDKDPVSGAKQP